MSEHSKLMEMHTQFDALIAELDKVCFDPQAPADANLRARIRRQQIVDVKDLLLGKTSTLRLL